jgi:hypothetical protein
VAERTGDPALADPGGTGDKQIAVLADPVAGREPEKQRPVEPARGVIIDVLDAGGVSQPGIAQPGGKPLVAAMGELAIEQEAEPVVLRSTGQSTAQYLLGGQSR